jgi:hypothetical protein
MKVHRSFIHVNPNLEAKNECLSVGDTYNNLDGTKRNYEKILTEKKASF